MRGRAQKVAVSVDADDALLENIIEALRPDMLQLHGKESVARVRDIKARFRLPVMKVIPVATEGRPCGPCRLCRGGRSHPVRCARAEGCDAAGRPRRAFDWHLLEGLDLKVPFMVSGGLNAANVADAVRITGAGGVDVSSGVESAPGVKDPEKIREFIRAARAAEQTAQSTTGEWLMALAKPNSFRTGPDERGHFGMFGGRFVAETLMPLILDLEKAYAEAQGRSGVPQRDGRAPEALCRPSVAALLRRAPVASISAARRSI